MRCNGLNGIYALMQRQDMKKSTRAFRVFSLSNGTGFVQYKM